MGKEINNSSANAQSNGWTFEYAAALIIYLENMNDATSFCVEGSDDIVVCLKNSKIVAQAKSSLKQDEIIANHFSEIIESIRTLAQNDDAVELISISNFHAPLGQNDSFSFGQFLDKRSYSKLTTASQNRIKSKCNELGYAIDFQKFKLWFLRFEGDCPELGIQEYLKSKLSKIKFSDEFPMNDLMNQWLHIIQLNGRDRCKVIETETMCGTLFGKILANTNLEKITRLIKEDIDPCYEDSFGGFFKEYFSKNSQNFRIYSEIAYAFIDYANKYRPTNNEKYEIFAKYYCDRHSCPTVITEYFSGYEERDELASSLYRLFIAYVCFKKEAIASIRKAFGYENN